MIDMQEWLAETRQRDDRLYEEYGKPLEDKHVGELVAIGLDGRTILGASFDELAKRAIRTFGSGNFALRRVGSTAVLDWLELGAKSVTDTHTYRSVSGSRVGGTKALPWWTQGLPAA